MRLDATLRTFHGRRRFRDVHALEIAQQKCLPLAGRQPGDGLLQRRHGFVRLELCGRLCGAVHGQVHGIDRVLLVLASPWHKGHHPAAHIAPALHVADAIFEDAIEQRLPFLGRTQRVARAELHHRILHHVERISFVTQRDLCDPEGLALYARQKCFERARGILGRITQMGLPGWDQINRLIFKTSKSSHATASILSETPSTTAQRRRNAFG